MGGGLFGCGFLGCRFLGSSFWRNLLGSRFDRFDAGGFGASSGAALQPGGFVLVNNTLVSGPVEITLGSAVGLGRRGGAKSLQRVAQTAAGLGIADSRLIGGADAFLGGFDNGHELPC